METIAHRELRNNSSRILARVADGESIVVTNHGIPAAMLVPVLRTELERLLASGRARAPRRPEASLHNLPRARGISSEEVLTDLRGDR